MIGNALPEKADILTASGIIAVFRKRAIEAIYSRLEKLTSFSLG
jgi:hypothetical protein